jgi:hypothetical protein
MLKREIKCGGIQQTEFGKTNLEKFRKISNILFFFITYIYKWQNHVVVQCLVAALDQCPAEDLVPLLVPHPHPHPHPHPRLPVVLPLRLVPPQLPPQEPRLLPDLLLLPDPLLLVVPLLLLPQELLLLVVLPPQLPQEPPLPQELVLKRLPTFKHINNKIYYL